MKHQQVEMLLRTDGRRLHALLYRLTLSTHAADDLLQELAVRLMQADPGRVRELAGYATRTAVHLGLDWRHRRARQANDLPDVGDPRPTPDEQIEHRESLERLLDAVQRLREPLREIVVLRYIEDQSYEAIAAALGKTSQQVRGLAHKAIVALRTELHTHSPSRRTDHARTR